MHQLFPFFLVVVAGVFFSDIFKRLHLPWVVALLFGGIILGPSFLGILPIEDPSIQVISQIGLIFLLFMAGLETTLSSLSSNKKNIFVVACLNGVIPFIVGISVATLLGFGVITALLIGVMFISSSVSVIVPMLEETGMIQTNLGKIIVGSAIFQDIVSLLLLSFFLQVESKVTALPLPVFYVILALFFYVAVRFSSRLKKFILSGEGRYQGEIRIVLAILIGAVILFEVVGVHAIVGGFIVGLMLSESVQTAELKAKLRALGYGIFIPTFFIVVGASVSLPAYEAGSNFIAIAVSLLAAFVFSKTISGFLAGRVLGFTGKESALLAWSTLPQMSTTLAIAFTAGTAGLVTTEIIAVFVVISIVTTFVTPFLVRVSAAQVRREQVLIAERRWAKSAL